MQIQDVGQEGRADNWVVVYTNVDQWEAAGTQMRVVVIRATAGAKLVENHLHCTT